MSEKDRGLYNKYSIIERADGLSEPGQKHDGCEYFVLDVTHDSHALAALVAYAADCAETFPTLSEHIRHHWLGKELIGPLPFEHDGRR